MRSTVQRNSTLRRTLALLTTVVTVSLAGCSSADDGGPDSVGDEAQRFPDVLDVEVRRAGETYEFEVTMSSPYDTPERYADGWRVRGSDGTVYGEHELLHDHAAEQPFTRTQTGVAIPDGVTEVIVEGRDGRFGYGGQTVTVSLPRG
jgi:hypothetical protein